MRNLFGGRPPSLAPERRGLPTSIVVRVAVVLTLAALAEFGGCVPHG